MSSRRTPSEQSESSGPIPPACFVYIVECEGGWLYTGTSSNPERRFREHQVGGARFTKGRPAVRLLWTESHPSRVEAQKRERQIKRWTRRKKLALAAGDLELLKKL